VGEWASVALCRLREAGGSARVPPACGTRPRCRWGADEVGAPPARSRTQIARTPRALPSTAHFVGVVLCSAVDSCTVEVCRRHGPSRASAQSGCVRRPRRRSRCTASALTNTHDPHATRAPIDDTFVPRYRVACCGREMSCTAHSYTDIALHPARGSLAPPAG